MLLVAEMALFMVLIIPLPFNIRRKMFTFMYGYHPLLDLYTMLTITCRSESPIIAKLQYGMKITFIFILILFIDSVNRVYRVQVELAESKDSGGYVPFGHSMTDPPRKSGLIRVAERQS